MVVGSHIVNLDNICVYNVSGQRGMCRVLLHMCICTLLRCLRVFSLFRWVFLNVEAL